MRVGPLTSESDKALNRAESAIDGHAWPWWAFGFKPGRRRPWRNAGRRYDVARTIAPAVEESVRASIAAGLATLDDPAWADAIKTAIRLVSISGEWEPEEKPKPHPAPLPPFSGEAGTCAKCGRGGASSEYGYGEISISRPRVELQRRTCPGCGYRWLERCADAQPLEEPSPDDAAAEAGSEKGGV
jgi:hypothetical protein